MLNITKTLFKGFNYGWDNGTQSTFHHGIADVNDNGLHPQSVTDDNVKVFHLQSMTGVNDNVSKFTKSEHLNDRLNECLNEDQVKFDIICKRFITQK